MSFVPVLVDLSQLLLPLSSTVKDSGSVGQDLMISMKKLRKFLSQTQVRTPTFKPDLQLCLNSNLNIVFLADFCVKSRGKLKIVFDCYHDNSIRYSCMTSTH